MKIKILTVGKIANKQLMALSEDYLSRIRHYVPIQTEFVRAEKISALSEKEIIAQETKRLIDRLSEAEWKILLHKGGATLTSEAFSDYLAGLALHSHKYVTFIIGGPLGTGKDLEIAANFSLSLSKMTFSHELSTIILLEQLYRAFSIMRGEKYHK
jgi:23S rRNA (pseudouridine1915-N3)-methyltransferase